MKSPAAPDTSLARIELEPGLEAFRCPVSGGTWIPLQSYENWKQGYRSGSHPLPPGYVPDTADDSQQPALLCPESGCLLVRFRVGRGLNFHIERSPRTGGVWLGAGEWDALKSKGLDRELHLIFSHPYQQQIVRELRDEQLRKQFAHRIGEPDFQRVADFVDWLSQHPKQRDIVAYLREHIKM